MNLIKKMSSWAFFNGFAVTLVYLGFYAGVAGAANLFLFINVVAALYACIMITAPCVEAIAKSELLKDEGWYYKLDVTFDLLLTAAVVWAGHPVIGAIYLLHSILLIHLRKSVAEKRKSLELEEALTL